MEQPQFYTSLASHLSAEDQSVIQGVIMKAAETDQQEALAQASAAASTPNPLNTPGQINGGAS
jgi:importin-7